MDNKEKEYIMGRWLDGSGNEYWVRYKKNFGEHVFSDEENRKLLRGEKITFTNSKGKETCGCLQKNEFPEGNYYFGFWFVDNDEPLVEENVLYDPSLFPKFIQDMNNERLVHLFVKQHFYSKLKNADETNARLEYYSDRAIQEKGLDLMLYYDDKEYKIDEKSQTDYIFEEKPLPSFSMELLNSGSDNIGWFVNDELETEYYMFFWPHADEKPKKFGRVDDLKYIEYVDYALVERKNLKEYIEKNYCGIERLREYADLISKGKLDGSYEDDGKIKFKRKPFDRDVYLVFSKDLKEQPVNLVVKKHIIEEQSQKRGQLKRDD